MQYQNEYGTVNLTPVTPMLPIADINRRLPAVQANLLDLDAAERIALITSNKGIQLCALLDGTAYVVLHDGPRHGAVCRCDIVVWQSTESACDTLSDLHQYPYAGPIPVL